MEKKTGGEEKIGKIRLLPIIPELSTDISYIHYRREIDQHLLRLLTRHMNVLTLAEGDILMFDLDDDKFETFRIKKSTEGKEMDEREKVRAARLNFYESKGKESENLVKWRVMAISTVGGKNEGLIYNETEVFIEGDPINSEDAPLLNEFSEMYDNDSNDAGFIDVTKLCIRCGKKPKPPPTLGNECAYLCPCSQMIINEKSPTWIEVNEANEETIRNNPGIRFMRSLKHILATLPPFDYRSTLLYDMIERSIPRLQNGRLNYALLNRVAQHLYPKPRGLEKEKLNKLPVVKYVHNNKNNKLNIEKCQICLEDFTKDSTIRVLPCYHQFHKDCIDKWLETSSLCCSCRFDLSII
jgi:hypothetical protein